MPSSVFAHKPLDGLLQYLPCRQWQVMLTGHRWQTGLRVAVALPSVLQLTLTSVLALMSSVEAL